MISITVHAIDKTPKTNIWNAICPRNMTIKIHIDLQFYILRAMWRRSMITVLSTVHSKIKTRFENHKNVMKRWTTCTHDYTMMGPTYLPPVQDKTYISWTIAPCNPMDFKVKRVIFFTRIGAMYKFTIKFQYSYFLKFRHSVNWSWNDIRKYMGLTCISSSFQLILHVYIPLSAQQNVWILWSNSLKWLG